MSVLMITNFLLSGINCAQEILYCFYQLSLFVGYCILVTFINLYELFLVIIFYTSELLKVLKDDFGLFLNDVASTLLLLWTFVCEGLCETVSTLEGLSNKINGVFSSVYLNFISLFENSIYQSIFNYFILEPADLTISALSLIGRCVASVTQNICSVILNIHYLPLFILTCAKKSVLFLKSQAQNFLNYEALYGLMIVLGTSYLCYKSKFYLKVGSTCGRIFTRMCMSGAKYLCAFFSSIYNSGARFVKLRKRTNRLDECFDADSKEAQLLKQLERERAAKLCVVCMDQQRNIMLLNCKHIVLCSGCADILVYESGECPICRTYVTQMVNVYL